VSVRFRDSVFKETGHTIMNLLTVRVHITPSLICPGSILIIHINLNELFSHVHYCFEVFFCLTFLKEVSSHKGCIYLIKDTVKTVML